MQGKSGLIFITHAANSIINCNTSKIYFPRRKHHHLGIFQQPKPSSTNCLVYFNITAQLFHAYPSALSYQSCQFIQDTILKNPNNTPKRPTSTQTCKSCFSSNHVLKTPFSDICNSATKGVIITLYEFTGNTAL